MQVVLNVRTGHRERTVTNNGLSVSSVCKERVSAAERTGRAGALL